MKCCCPLKDVYESGFAVIETNLFLDTHPCCAEALAYYADAVAKYKCAKKAYSESYGPLTMTTPGDDYHNWIDGPWPWEGGSR